MIVAAGCGGGGSSTSTNPSDWARKNHLPAAALPGARLFVENRCLTCHTYLGAGNLVAESTDLTDEGSKGKSLANLVDHMTCPSCVTAGSPMPAYASLGTTTLRRIAIFLEASKGGK